MFEPTFAISVWDRDTLRHVLDTRSTKSYPWDAALDSLAHIQPGEYEVVMHRLRHTATDWFRYVVTVRDEPITQTMRTIESDGSRYLLNGEPAA